MISKHVDDCFCIPEVRVVQKCTDLVDMKILQNKSFELHKKWLRYNRERTVQIIHLLTQIELCQYR